MAIPKNEWVVIMVFNELAQSAIQISVQHLLCMSLTNTGPNFSQCCKYTTKCFVILKTLGFLTRLVHWMAYVILDNY